MHRGQHGEPQDGPRQRGRPAPRRRRHRHIIYCGYGLVFAIIALCWALAVRYPGPRHDLIASIASVGAWVAGSLAILVYKAWQTRDPRPGDARARA